MLQPKDDTAGGTIVESSNGLGRRLLEVAWGFLLWERAVSSPQAAAIALLAFGFVAFFRTPAPLVILGSGVLGWGFSIL